MARALDPVVADTLKKYGFGKDALWDCHGVWVVYHKVLEQIAAQAGVSFDPPQILEANGLERLAAICVTGRIKDKTEWSIGEASPHNYKTTGKQQPYPWAMAEKRAKDRVILKLIGLHGFVYSEEEADDFKAPQQSQPQPEPKNHGEACGPLTITKLKDEMRAFCDDLARCTDKDELIALLNSDHTKAITEQCSRDLPVWWFGKEGSDNKGIAVRIVERRAELSKLPHEMLKAG